MRLRLRLPFRDWLASVFDAAILNVVAFLLMPYHPIHGSDWMRVPTTIFQILALLVSSITVVSGVYSLWMWSRD